MPIPHSPQTTFLSAPTPGRAEADRSCDRAPGIAPFRDAVVGGAAVRFARRRAPWDAVRYREAEFAEVAADAIFCERLEPGTRAPS